MIDITKKVTSFKVDGVPMILDTPIQNSVTLTLTNLKAQLTNKIGSKNVSFTLVPNSGYLLPDNITFSDGITDGIYDNTTGSVTFTAPKTTGESIIGVAEMPTLTFTAEQENSTVGYTIQGTVDTSGISYKLNNGEWTSWTDGSSITLANVGDKIQVKNSNNTLSSEDGDNCLQFTMNGLIAAMGDVDSMINYAALTEFCYFSMFKDCTALVTAPMLKSTTLAYSCYNNMFANCTGLTTLPSNFLPATTLADECYYEMFRGCTGLTTLPSNFLPATTLAYFCYYQMFYDCSSLINIPSLPATTLADSCYANMFMGCTGLTTIPSDLLPATTLAVRCYQQMFSGCSSLTNVSDFPAITLANYCYYYMFYNCTSLTTIPELPATTLASSCYQGMFVGCTGLTTIPSNFLPATTLANNCYREMFRGCTNLTTIPSNLLPATTLTQGCYQQMFDGCTNLTTLPSNLLPATTLAGFCYSTMFYGCSGLTTLPSLPATTLAEFCYYSMFYGCSKIKLSSMQSAEYPNAYRIPYGTEQGTDANNAMQNMFTSTGGTFTGDPEINTTYYTSNEVV